MTNYNKSFDKLSKNPCINVPPPNVQRDLPGSIQIPIAASPTAYASQINQIAKSPICHGILGQNISRSRINVQMDKEIPIPDRDLVMKKDLKRRGLGLIAELANCLEEDRKIQAKARSANDYDMMSPKDIYSLYTRRSVATNDTDSILKGRLEARDRKKDGIEAPGSRLNPILVPIGPVDDKGSREVSNKKPLVPTVITTPTLVTDKAENIGQTAKIVTPIIPKDCVGLESIHGASPGHNINKACSECRRSKVCSIFMV